MDIFSSWLFKYVLTRAANAVFEKCSRNGTLDKCRNAVGEWCKKLPEDEKLLTADSLFHTLPNHAGEDPAPGPRTVLQCFDEGTVPTEAAWKSDLLNQWEWVRSQISEPAPFFTISSEKAEAHLADLAQRLYQVCCESPELFQHDVHKAVTHVRQDTATILNVVSEESRKTSLMLEQLTALSQAKSEEELQADIEEAIAYTKDGKPQLAEACLKKLRDSKWNSLTPYQKYKLVANFGIALLEQGKRDLAAESFVECAAYEPEKEEPRCWAANGYLIQQNLAKCNALVQSVLEDYPNSTFGHALRIYAAPDDLDFDEIEALVPEQLHADSSIAMALSERALFGRLFTKSESYARIACKGDSPAPSTQKLLATILIESTIRSARVYLSDKPPVDQRRLKEGAALLTDAISGFEARGDREAVSSCHFWRGRANHFLGDDGGAESDFNAAYQANPLDPRYVTQFALALSDAGKEGKAVELLEGIADCDDSLHASTLAAQLLDVERNPAECTRVKSVLEKARQHFPGEIESANVEYVNALVDAYCAEANTQDALREAEDLSSKLSGAARKLAMASANRKCGVSSHAKELIREAVDLSDAQTDLWTRLRIAQELEKLGLEEESFQLLKEIVPATCESIATRALIRIAQVCGEDGFLLSFLASIRDAGVFHPDYVDAELYLLGRYHEDVASTELIESLIATNQGGEGFAQELRVRQEFIRLLYGGREQGSFEISDLPSSAIASLQVGSLVVHLLILHQRWDDARCYAYSLVRRFFEDKESHQALIASFLLEDKKDAVIHPETVAPGTGVCFVESGTTHEQCVIIEDEKDPEASRDEFASEHHVYGRMLGKKVGDKFSTSTAEFQELAAKITRINDKKVLRFNKSIQEYDRRFGGQFLVKFSLEKADDGSLDLGPIKKAVKAHADAVGERDEVYRQFPISMTSYAMLSDASVVDVVGHLADQQLPIRCCSGTEHEERNATRVLESRQRIVLDPSSVATLIHVNAISHLRDLPVEILVPKSVVIDLKSALESLTRHSESGSLQWSGSSVVFTATNESQRESWKSLLVAAVETLTEVGSLVSGKSLSALSVDRRKEVVELFGWEAAESIAIAAEQKAGLWTDDHAVALYSAEHFGVERVWTQLVCQWAMQESHLTPQQCIDVTAKLVALGYWHTKLFPDAALKMAEESEWDSRREPLSAVLRWLGTAGVNANAIGEVAEAILPELYRERVGVTQDASVLEVLTSIAKRRDGLLIIKELNRRVGVFCRHRYAVENELRRALGAWLEVVGKKRIV